mgnify:CR=1 FL=1
MKKKKVSCFGLVCVMCLALLAGCGNGGAGEKNEAAPSNAAAENNQTAGDTSNEKTPKSEVSITLLNTKPELVEQFEKMAKEYKAQTGVDIEAVYTADVVSTYLAGKYASGSPYTIMMVDRPDVYDFQEYLLDLSNENWVKDGGSTYGVKANDKLYGFPMLIESVGLLYNAQAIEDITGQKFVSANYNTPEKFKALLEELVKGGMEKPVAINKDDWSLANHFFGQLYDQQGNSEEGSQAFVDSLKKGEINLMEDKRFNSLMDSFDMLAKYNINGADPLSADYDMNNTYFAEGDVAFWFNGSWATEVYDKTNKIGMMPLPQSDTEGGVNDNLISGASKTLVIDQKYSTEQQQQAAKDFLNWLVYDDAGQSFMVNDCNITPAFANIDKKVSAPLSVSAQEFIQNQATEYWYQAIPGDHGTEVGASLQKYLAGNIDRNGLAKEVEEYWKNQK